MLLDVSECIAVDERDGEEKGLKKTKGTMQVWDNKTDSFVYKQRHTLRKLKSNAISSTQNIYPIPNIYSQQILIVNKKNIF